MPRMRAVDAAVAILRAEGVSNVFGLPGAAINPFYSAMRADGTIRHTLARHVEGAAHMAEGYTRAASGNIGVCVGTSGPASTSCTSGESGTMVATTSASATAPAVESTIVTPSTVMG